ncbi:hypothetical protein BB560_001657 [Smittium megazygosporum]|uniref:Aromatic amino acid beta-eliminating lyase/threonine aldolase domain-containing protein n=1 Tax=Smittium megazygosporum TaxID=133381 RepID=A0A2T9ZGW7_9FUNG|nr:hypothetical protein BB560_001657 [Smittium megazygosporum]
MVEQTNAPYDFRSDTLTKPTPEMLEAMLHAEVGDDVYDEDPTIHKLEKYIVELTGKEAALFCASSTMSNQIAARTHLPKPPHSIICDDRAHIFRFEAGGLAIISQTMVYPITPKNGVYITAEEVRAKIVPAGDPHFSPTRLIEIENTLGGSIMPIEEMEKIKALANEKQIKVHLDGARLWNVCAATNTEMKAWTQHVDSVNLCLSKGIGAPVGAVLAGTKEFIEDAKFYKKLMGGGWRQAGVLAAAALVAIETIWPKMSQDHDRAKKIEQVFAKYGFSTLIPVDTNMVMVNAKGGNLDVAKLSLECKKLGVIIRDSSPDVIRFVVHHHIDDKAVDLIDQALKATLDN